MQARGWSISLVLLSVALAGCVGQASPDEPRFTPTGDPAAPVALADLTREDLLAHTVTFTTEPGRWAMVRLVLDEDMWEWDEKDEESASASLLFAMRADVPEDGYATYMDAFATTSESGTGDLEPPRVTFIPFTESFSRSGGLGFSMAGSSAVPDQPPVFEWAWLLGSEAGEVRWRFALLEDDASTREQRAADLEGRPLLPLQADVTGEHAFAGIAADMETLVGHEPFLRGHPITREVTSSLPQPGVAPVDAATTLTYRSEAEFPAPGTTSGLFVASRIAGPSTWGYRLDHPSTPQAYDATWVHPYTPDSAYAPMARPSAAFQARADAGPVTFEGWMDFTGVRHIDRFGQAQDGVIWGYADVDLEAAYGWPWEDRVPPPAGDAVAVPDARGSVVLERCLPVALADEPLCFTTRR